MTTRDSRVVEQPAQSAAGQPPAPGFLAGLLAELKQSAYIAASASTVTRTTTSGSTSSSDAHACGSSDALISCGSLWP
jgi:hypothetical protein